MTRVLLHPTGSSTQGLVNWDKTLADPVDFRTSDRFNLLTADQQRSLLRVHPDGHARFWGTFDEDWRLRHLRATGDGSVVVFTAKSAARGIGVIGHIFNNARFADTLWDPDQDGGSYSYVYSLDRLESAKIPYPELRKLLGLSTRYPFRRLDSLDESQSELFVQRVHVDFPGPFTYARADEEVAERLAGTTQLRPVPTTRTRFAVVHIAETERVMNRGEALLVERFVEWLGSTLQVGVTSSSAGITDLYINRDGKSEVIEAKSRSDIPYVRQALSQLLHYAPSLDVAPDVLTALFPQAPKADGVELLHRYGIDCVYLEGEEFVRLSATDARRARVAALWR